MRPVKITLVVALAENGVIGRDNGLAWHLRGDLKRFKAVTMGKPMLMGRKTYASIGRPLPGRRTLVMTRDPAFAADGIETVHDWSQALAAAAAEELMVVGGAEIYRLALPHADALRLTEVAASPDGDTRFPAFDRTLFRETFRERIRPVRTTSTPTRSWTSNASRENHDFPRMWRGVRSRLPKAAPMPTCLP